MKLWHWLATFLLAGLLGLAVFGCVEPAPCPGGTWVPGHHNRFGHWVSGHWRCPTPGYGPSRPDYCPPGAARVWRPGHYNRWGQWIDGRWVCR